MHVTRLFCPPLNPSPQGEKGDFGRPDAFFSHSPARLSCTQGREIGRPDEPKRGCVRSHVQTAGHPSCSSRRCASRFPSDSHNQEKGRMRVEPFIVLTTGADVPVAAVPNRRARTPSTHLQTRERAASQSAERRAAPSAQVRSGTLPGIGLRRTTFRSAQTPFPGASGSDCHCLVFLLLMSKMSPGGSLPATAETLLD